MQNFLVAGFQIYIFSTGHDGVRKYKMEDGRHEAVGFSGTSAISENSR